jgi:hypothetical protein
MSSRGGLQISLSNAENQGPGCIIGSSPGIAVSMSYLNKQRLAFLLGLVPALAVFCCGAQPFALARGSDAQRTLASGHYRSRFPNSSHTKAPPAQKKRTVKTQKPKGKPPTELNKLRDQYIQTTKELKASLEKLLALYEASQKKAEDRYAQSEKLFKDGLISKNQLEEYELAVTSEKNKVAGVKQQIAGAETHIAQTLIEIEGGKQMAKLGRLPRGGYMQTTSLIRYSGAGGWVLSNAGRIQNFFLQRFSRPLPVAVFGQGAIHERWRLDHRNAMDISLNPDTAEGQALMEFLRANGIPFLAFRGAIPGVATGPHIHIGLPSHRY